MSGIIEGLSNTGETSSEDLLVNLNIIILWLKLHIIFQLSDYSLFALKSQSKEIVFSANLNDALNELRFWNISILVLVHLLVLSQEGIGIVASFCLHDLRDHATTLFPWQRIILI